MEVQATMAGSVWKINVNEGDQVEEGQDIVILESMKMEIPVSVEKNGVVKQLKVQEGDLDRKSTRLNSSHVSKSYAVFCLKKKNKQKAQERFFNCIDYGDARDQ